MQNTSLSNKETINIAEAYEQILKKQQETAKQSVVPPKEVLKDAPKK